MNRLVAFVKNIRPLKFIAVAFLSLCLVFSQAANAVAAAAKPNPLNNSEYYTSKEGNALSRDKNTLNKYEGGMNNFSDLDARSHKAEARANAEAKALKQQAEKNAQKQSGNLVENVRRVANDSDKLGKNIQSQTDSIKDKLGAETESFADSTKQGLQNIKNNAQSAPDYASKVSDRTVGNQVDR
ncbi:hypothetical protein [Calothrix sp. UHCC 0171]|uniref:hypothetical protein n=1 Tax=Calothrix sp. UHCC 0171 TaxID=3110245 RepID=UPI002B1E9905|nr:hypothetical protein [Calothrix sp. UHCC 0171]MEA5570051.1 hypothetical protein [Calothrix sp. UHCC 0171]